MMNIGLTYLLALFTRLLFLKCNISGDFEVQRHWVEVTNHIPVQEWYVNTTDNDLLYWGLDYPPLTAYHSYAIGKLSTLVSSSKQWFTLHKSRGYASEGLVLYMKLWVLLCDLAIFIPACLMLHHDGIISGLSTGLLVINPVILIVDYGHFQFNCVSLGLFLWAVRFLLKGHHKTTTVLFTSALLYKQMELYHALPFLCYYIGFSLCNTFSESIKILGKLALTAITTIIIIFLPFLPQDVLPVINRMFPVGRGLYEDKVANVWCSTSPFIKWKELYDTSFMAKICFALILTLHTPMVFAFDLTVFNGKNISRLKHLVLHCFLCSSMVFFLFGYHVHEKSILLSVVPACLLFDRHPLETVLFIFVSLGSLAPMLDIEGNTPALVCLAGATLVSLTLVFLAKRDEQLRGDEVPESCDSFLCYAYQTLRPAMVFCVVIPMCLLILLPIVVLPPARYPYLWPQLTAMFCFCYFMIYFVVVMHGIIYPTRIDVRKTSPLKTGKQK